MKPTFLLLARATLPLALLPLGAQAAPTNIAQSPLLNIAGTGAVKPNLMVLYDNSGSMVRDFTPDYVDDSVCRSNATLAAATPRGCKAGDPPFNAAEFNKQYYNPSTWYKPPVKADGSSYPSMTKAYTQTWAVVPIDPFGINKLDLRADEVSSTNLVTNFPDYSWCNSTARTNCLTNAVTYTFPNASYKYSNEISGNPFYYNINVAEHCTDATLKTCIPTRVGAPAPAGYPVPARVRFCTTTSLTTCQAKYMETHKYPRFSNASSGNISYGLLQVPSVTQTTSRRLNSLSVGGVQIQNVAVTAATGLNTVDKQNAMATAIAASIIAKNGLSSAFTACVRAPTSTSVPDCGRFGLIVADGAVALIPVTCEAGATTKEIGDVCNFVLDNSRVGQTITVDATVTMATTAIVEGNAVFTRVDLIESRNEYPRGAKRDDCAAATHCTYIEEMTNFANWYAYNRTRNQMMKTAVGMAFAPVGENYNVGLVSLSKAAAGQPMNQTPKPFNAENRTTWYSQLYGMTGNQATPTRAGLHSIGQMYANTGNYVAAVGQEVVKYPCQQNFAFVTTDGYWNGGAPDATVTNNDRIENANRFCTKASGCVQPDDADYTQGVSLADVALHWYNGGSSTGNTSLRPALEDYTVPEGLVRGEPGGNTRLHMTTFTLGLGVDGLMTYEPDYKDRPRPAGDFIKVLNRVPTGCPWNNNGEWVWPDPQVAVTSTDPQSRVDDLWHAAVNGRGQYFSAAEPDEVVESLTRALLNIESKVGAAAAAATSTPNISLQDNDIFSDTFTTVKWFGELTNRKIDTITGEVRDQKEWSSSNTVGTKVAAGTDTRTIKMFDASVTASGSRLKDFKYSVMTPGEQAWFVNKCAALLQCDDMTPAQRTTANNGAALVDWLRGQQQHADDVIFRKYSSTGVDGGAAGIPIVLGDIASSKPAFMREPRLGYTFDNYPVFADTNASRQPTVFVGANDGMLHAFNATTGNEMWAYAPRITMQKLHKQASTTYGGNHQYTVDGSPEVTDVRINNEWRTVLVSGLNGGGRGYFALDVTNPSDPKALWELCADASVCSGTSLEPELGLTFGNPQFGIWRNKWVVFLTSGYNNIPGSDGVAGGSGNGFLFIVDVATGAVLSKVPTNHIGVAAGNVTTPSGLAKISAVSSNPNVNPVITDIYGGDNLGNMWRFELAGPTVTRLRANGVDQPITTRPEVTMCGTTQTVSGEVVEGAERVIVFGTGRLLDVPDLSSTTLQSVYAIKDPVSSGALIEQTLSALGTGGAYRVSTNAVDLRTNAGWFLKLNQNARERVNLDPKIVDGSLTVVTNIPGASTTCSVGGSSKVYRLDVCTGSFVNGSSTRWLRADGTDPNGPGATGPEYAVAGETLAANAAAVGYIMVQLPTGVIKMVTTKADGDDETDDGPGTKSHDARKAGWRRVTN